MKLRTLCGCLLLSLAGAAFGQVVDDTVGQIDGLIRLGLDRTLAEVRELSLDLTEEQRLGLFQEHQRAVRYYPLLNVLPGVGLGSRLQGDRLGHVILAVGDVAGVGLLVGGAIWALSTMEIDLFGDGGSGGDPRAFTMAAVGGGMMIGMRIVGIWWSLTYPGKYNAKLRMALHLRD